MNFQTDNIIKKFFKFTAIAIVLVIAIGGGWYWYCSRVNNPWNAATIGDIPAPKGYERVGAPVGSELAFFRSLPLKPKGRKVKLYTGGNA